MKHFKLDLLDLHYYFHKQTARRKNDGIHWDAPSHRRITNLILNHLCESWNIESPGRILIKNDNRLIDLGASRESDNDEEWSDLSDNNREYNTSENEYDYNNNISYGSDVGNNLGESVNFGLANGEEINPYFYSNSNYPMPNKDLKNTFINSNGFFNMNDNGGNCLFSGFQYNNGMTGLNQVNFNGLNLIPLLPQPQLETSILGLPPQFNNYNDPSRKRPYISPDLNGENTNQNKKRRITNFNK
jgi:hypothetical protein